MSAELIDFFFELQTNIKLYHWMTSSYARHKGSDQLQGTLGEKIDRFVEVYIGRLGKPKVHKKQVSYRHMTDKEIVGYLKDKVKYLEKLDLSKWHDLSNIRAEIVETINQGLYLFELV
jgi:hypothetical protein